MTSPPAETGDRTGSSRPRDPADSRTALLDAARDLFATEGYQATTVRAIADRAGVNQAMLFRYFGNKAGLFSEAVLGEALRFLADTPRSELLERTLEAILADDHGRGAATIMAVVKAAGSAQVAEGVRAQLGDAYISAFAALVETDDPADAELRAGLLLSWLMGISLARRVLHTRPRTDPRVVTEHVLRAARALLAAPPTDS